MNMQKYIPEYEEIKGEKLDPQVVRIIGRLDECGKQFERRGREDASQSRPAASKDEFRSWAKKAFDNDSEMAEIMADLMRGCYMDGYEARDEVEKTEVPA